MMKDRREEKGGSEKRERGGSGGGLAVPYTPGHIHWVTEGRFCAFRSADLQSIFRRTDLFQRAVGPGVSVLRVVARMSLDGGIWKKGGYRKQRSSQAFCTHLDFPFLFFLSLFFTSSLL